MTQNRSMKISYFDVPKIEKFPLFRDERGFFSLTPLKDSWTQGNISFNEKIFVFRGVHYQEGSYAQSKCIQVYTGKIADYIVDIRPESRTFGEVESFILEPGDCITIPRGYAHAFLTLAPNTIVQYFVDNVYSKQHEGSIAWDSIVYMEDEILELVEDRTKIVISKKDQEGETWENFEKRVLPERRTHSASY